MELSTGVGKIGQDCLWEWVGLVKSSAGPGRNCQEILQNCTRLVKIVCGRRQDWSGVFAGAGSRGADSAGIK